MSRRETYEVKVTRPDGVTNGEMNEYIRDAISAHGGAFHSDDPLFGHAVDPVVVRRANEAAEPSPHRGYIVMTQEEIGRLDHMLATMLRLPAEFGMLDVHIMSNAVDALRAMTAAP